MLNNGFLYIHKRDKSFRPVVVLNVQKMTLFTAEQNELVIPVTNYLMTYAINHISIPGRAEAFMIVLDLNGVGMTQFPMTILK